jgi:pimeloyl-ACP methyl ester carboxylesterase
MTSAFLASLIAQGQRMHEAMASSPLVLIEKIGYMPWLEHPAAFEAACEQWFEENYA